MPGSASPGRLLTDMGDAFYVALAEALVGTLLAAHQRRPRPAPLAAGGSGSKVIGDRRA